MDFSDHPNWSIRWEDMIRDEHEMVLPVLAMYGSVDIGWPM